MYASNKALNRIAIKHFLSFYEGRPLILEDLTVNCIWLVQASPGGRNSVISIVRRLSFPT